jgi:hypothetical protein
MTGSLFSGIGLIATAEPRYRMWVLNQFSGACDDTGGISTLSGAGNMLLVPCHLDTGKFRTSIFYSKNFKFQMTINFYDDILVLEKI